MIAERDRFLTEALGHKFKKPGHGTCCTCSACGYDYDNCICIDYSEWCGFGILWEWATKQDWWDYFLNNTMHIGEAVGSEWDYYFDVSKINPNKFADAIYEFLKK